ncbi:hypothetical protein VP01_4845g1 [Puccinia sorghi]|uniref:Uncharacterized protein n=1 Tax=Puccinia sorghi TaxID=27349 RepID=A0A0L6UN47_9BASI|nr:hypothetical protein VP01_4845g1 [Puccinia sorghi]
MQLLEPLSKATDMLCASKYPTPKTALPIYIVLIQHLLSIRPRPVQLASAHLTSRRDDHKNQSISYQNTQKAVLHMCNGLGPKFQDVVLEKKCRSRFSRQSPTNFNGIQAEIKQYLNEDVDSAQRSLSGSPPAPTGTPLTAPTESSPTSQRQPGCAKGSQGYGEWGFVRDWYNVYATENNWAPCDFDPLKMEFWALVNRAKPTGNPDFPTYFCDAKSTQKSMDAL